MKCAKDMTPTKSALDKLWAKAIKLRAGMKSEYKHIPDSYLAAHHITGKSSYALRWSLDNGVCITTGQHHFVAHHQGRCQQFREWALKLRGVTEEGLRITARGKVDLFAIEIYLKQKIKEYEALL